MKKATYYIENSTTLNGVLEVLKGVIPCFIEREYIEMDYSEVTIIARIEDWVTVENYLAPLM